MNKGYVKKIKTPHGYQLKLTQGDFVYDIRNYYTCELFTRLLDKGAINYGLSVGCDYGYRVIVPIYSIYGYHEVTKLLDYAIANTLDI